MKRTVWTRLLAVPAAMLLLTAASCGAGGLIVRDHKTRSVTVTEPFDSVLVEVRTADIELSSAPGSSCLAELSEYSEGQYDVSVRDGVLTVREKSVPWYERFSLFSFRVPKVTVRLPEEEYLRLTLTGSTGDISLTSLQCEGDITVTLSTGDVGLTDVSSESLTLTGSTGDAALENVTVSGQILGTRSTGDRRLTNVSCGELDLTGSTGDDRLEDVIAAGRFSVERTTGDIRLERCDGEELILTADTGSITGSLLTGKDFDVSTKTGDLTVPEDSDGSSCSITTVTGDIRISVP